MTIGTLTAVPNATFSFRRSYISRVSVSGILGLPTIIGTTWFFPHPVLPNEDYYLVWRDNWFEWSSNSWQLNYIVKEYYHVFTGDPTHYPVDFSLTFIPGTKTHGADILNVPFGVSTPANHFPLDPAPPSYWLPPQAI